MDILQSVLLACSFIGVILCLFTPYLKIGLGVSILGFIGYFWMIDLSSWIPLFLFILGLFLIVLEFFIPDFGILGVAGFASFVIGLYLVTGDWMTVIQDISLALIITAVLTIILIRLGKVTQRWDQLILKSTSPEPAQNQDNHKRDKQLALRVGMEGITLTPLRPSGFARFELEDGQLLEIDVSTEIEALEKGEKIRIEKINGNKIIVRSV